MENRIDATKAPRRRPIEDVFLYEGQIRVVEGVLDVLVRPVRAYQVVHSCHFFAIGQQGVDKVGAHEPSPPCDHGVFCHAESELSQGAAALTPSNCGSRDGI